MEMMTNKYEVMFNPNEETALIRITEGKFKNFVYNYGQVSVGEVDNEENDLPISFTYELKQAPDSYEYVDEEADKKEFEQTVGDILYDIIVNSNTVKEANGNNDTEQSNEG